jgi:hypothetical protein
MPDVQTDTHPEAMRRQVELMRRAGMAGRFAAVRSLTRTVAGLSRRALRRRRPRATEAEIDRAFVALHYGEALARRLMDGA